VSGEAEAAGVTHKNEYVVLGRETESTYNLLHIYNWSQPNVYRLSLLVLSKVIIWEARRDIMKIKTTIRLLTFRRR